MQRGGGCGMRLFGAANNMASVFFSFKSRQRDASHALTSITQRHIRSTAEAESPRGKSTYSCVSSAYIRDIGYHALRTLPTGQHSIQRRVGGPTRCPGELRVAAVSHKMVIVNTDALCSVGEVGRHPVKCVTSHADSV